MKTTFLNREQSGERLSRLVHFLHGHAFQLGAWGGVCKGGGVEQDHKRELARIWRMLPALGLSQLCHHWHGVALCLEGCWVYAGPEEGDAVDLMDLMDVSEQA